MRQYCKRRKRKCGGFEDQVLLKKFAVGLAGDIGPHLGSCSTPIQKRATILGEVVMNMPCGFSPSREDNVGEITNLEKLIKKPRSPSLGDAM